MRGKLEAAGIVVFLFAWWVAAGEPAAGAQEKEEGKAGSVTAPGPAVVEEESKVEVEEEEEVEVEEEIEIEEEVEVEEEIEEEVEEKAPAEPPSVSDAVYETTNILHSSNVEEMVMGCVKPHVPGGMVDFSLVVDVDVKGRLVSLKVPRDMAVAAKQCLLREFQMVQFSPAREGYSVGAHYRLGFKEGLVAVEEEKEKEIEEEKIPPSERPFLKDPACNRMFYHQTAYTVPKKKVVMTFVDGGHLMLSVGASDNFDVTIGTMPPFMAWGLEVLPKVAFNVHEKVRIGIIPNVGFFFVIPAADETFSLMYGGKTVMSIGSEDMNLNIGVYVQGFSWWGWGDGEYDGEGERGFLVVAPELGASIRLARRVKLNVELMAPQLVHFRGENETFNDFRELEGINTINGKIWFIMAGLRILGKSFFWDAGLAWAVFPGWWDVQRFMPVGWPVFSFGTSI